MTDIKWIAVQKGKAAGYDYQSVRASGTIRYVGTYPSEETAKTHIKMYHPHFDNFEYWDFVSYSSDVLSAFANRTNRTLHGYPFVTPTEWEIYQIHMNQYIYNNDFPYYKERFL